MYQAYICKLKNVRKHPNADRLQLADCFGYQVIVGLDNTEDELGIYFSTDGKLSLAFLKCNDLLSYKDAEGNKKGGLFDERGKVKTQKLRGEKSEGYWCPISYLYTFMGFVADKDYSTVSTDFKYKEGDVLTEWNGNIICERYETLQTRKAAKGQQKSAKPKSMWFPEHVDTQQFLFELNKIPVGSRIVISEKLHGSSSRFGLIYTPHKPSWWKLWLNKIHLWYPTYSYEKEVGTRRVILSENKPDYYNDKAFRYNVATFQGLQDGEIIYGEIVGYTSNGSSIMPPHPTEKMKDKTVIQKYGNKITYSYGCEPNVNTESGAPQQDFYVYRIIIKRPDYSRELTQVELEQRCKELNLKTVPVLNSFVYDGNQEWLKQHVIDLACGESILDVRHIKEGVVLRVEIPEGNHAHDGQMYFFKYKSFEFRILEGISKEDDTVIDIEEAS